LNSETATVGRPGLRYGECGGGSHSYRKDQDFA
jgi:hypothetical protein